MAGYNSGFMRRLLGCTLAGIVLASAAASVAGIHFEDVARAYGLVEPNIYGGASQKNYILETTGNGVAIFDYDGDGRNDIFFANGARLNSGKIEASPSQLYHNEGGGHFRSSSQQAGFHASGWAQGVCTGDYDNDGKPDLLLTSYGHNVLYRNRG